MNANAISAGLAALCQMTVPLERTAGAKWFLLFALAGFAAFTAPAQDKFANSDCLDCHLDPNTTRVVNGKTEALIFPTNAFSKSVHAKLSCTDCHPGIKDLVHDHPLPPPNCAVCHTNEARDYASSIHGVSHLLGASVRPIAGIATAPMTFCRSQTPPRRSSR